MKQFVFCVLITMVFCNSYSQEYYIRKSIEKKYEKKYEGDRQKGEKAVEERLDAWDEKDKESRSKLMPFPTMSLTIDMNYPSKPKNNGTIDYYYKNFDCASVMTMNAQKNGMDRTIMNFKEGKMTMLMTDKKGKKTGMQMELKSVDWATKAAVAKSEKDLVNGQSSLKATDEYKTIEGYKCRKYLYETASYTSEMWMTNDSKIDIGQYNQSMYRIFSNSKNPSSNAFQEAGMNGMIIQHHMFPKDKRMEECIMTFKNIKMGSVPDEMFNTSGYEITQMPSIRDMWNATKDER